ncbi:hypothetical protein IPC828_10495 [Pseudomonas aeruginosa]|nr:hypothetical protein IPC828_10495 [Pseudomonas aeruginosa]
MPDMREEFEKWATKHRMPIHRDGVVTDYSARCTDECWQAWKASRAALRVELPDDGIEDCWRDWPNFCRDTFDTGYCYATDRITQALQQAGIEVKQ